MNHDKIVQQNKEAWNQLVDSGDPFTSSAKADSMRDPLGTVDPWGWLGDSIAGKNVLCLAAGGGKQGPLYSQAGANVTVVDLSDQMLAKDYQVQKSLDRKMRIFQASMDRMPMLQDSEFDIVIQPVSTCYLPNIFDVFQEVARVLSPGGLYISQHKTPTNLQSGVSGSESGVCISHRYYDKSPVPEAKEETSLREKGAVEFVHRWEEIVGGICRNGMVVEDLIEPNHSDLSAPIGSFGHRACFVAPYVRIKARKKKSSSRPSLIHLH